MAQLVHSHKAGPDNRAFDPFTTVPSPAGMDQHCLGKLEEGYPKLMLMKRWPGGGTVPGVGQRGPEVCFPQGRRTSGQEQLRTFTIWTA